MKRLFDLSCDPAEIAAALGPLAAQRPGLRLPGAVDGFELAVRAILGQQITVKAARTLAGRFAAAFGDAIDAPIPGLRTLFPSAERIAALKPSDIAETRRCSSARQGHRGSGHEPYRKASCGSKRAPKSKRRSNGCAACRGSANGPRSTSRCARCPGPTRFRTPTTACSKRWARRIRARRSSTRRSGSPGVPTPSCTCGNLWRTANREALYVSRQPARAHAGHCGRKLADRTLLRRAEVRGGAAQRLDGRSEQRAVCAGSRSSLQSTLPAHAPSSSFRSRSTGRRSSRASGASSARFPAAQR